MSASLIAGVYTIDGCRDGQPVKKIIKITGGNCELVTYSDGLGEEGFIVGDCTLNFTPHAVDVIIEEDGESSILDFVDDTVRSLTIVSKSDSVITIDGNIVNLIAGGSYTWNQGIEGFIDISSIELGVGEYTILWEL